ncbi:arginase family protein, partial [Halobacterium salinarum]
MFQNATDWTPTSTDPRDEQFGGVVEPVPTPSDADDYDAVLVGEPYDGAVIGRRGARDGPSAIRESLAGVKTHHFDAGAVSGVADLGDVVLPDGDVADT